MFIKDKDVLSEKNYEGNRLVEVTDLTIINLHKELNELQKEANPFLEKMDKLTPLLDPTYTKIGKLQNEITKLKDKIQSTKDKYDEELKKVELIDARAQLIKNKIQPLANKYVKDQLGEFEVANQILVKNDKLYVEIEDRLEAFIKKHRATKK